jgi:hypothetical protein
LKKIIRKIVRNLSIEIDRYRPSNSSSAQLAKVLEFLGINLVFDICVNEGQFAKEIREHGYSGKIISFEPLTSARKTLLSFASRDPSWQVHEQSAIGDQDSEIDIHIDSVVKNIKLILNNL